MISYETAKQMKELGLIQKRHDKALYYVNKNTIAYFEDIKNAFDAKTYEKTRKEEPVDWLDNYCYIPDLVDLIGIQQYDLTMEAAAYHFIDAKMSMQNELIKRNEDATKNP